MQFTKIQIQYLQGLQRKKTSEVSLFKSIIVFSKSWIKITILLILIALCLLGLNIPNVINACLGLWIGLVLRDIAWLRTGNIIWPAQKAVTDWGKVQTFLESALKQTENKN